MQIKPRLGIWVIQYVFLNRYKAKNWTKVAMTAPSSGGFSPKFYTKVGPWHNIYILSFVKKYSQILRLNCKNSRILFKNLYIGDPFLENIRIFSWDLTFFVKNVYMKFCLVLSMTLCTFRWYTDTRTHRLPKTQTYVHTTVKHFCKNVFFGFYDPPSDVSELIPASFHFICNFSLRNFGMCPVLFPVTLHLLKMSNVHFIFRYGPSLLRISYWKHFTALVTV